MLNRSISEKELEKIYEPTNNFRCIESAEWDWLDGISKEKFDAGAINSFNPWAPKAPKTIPVKPNKDPEINIVLFIFIADLSL